MGVSDWNWQLVADRQDYSWDCAAASLAWSLRTVGYEMSEQEVIAELGPTRISPSLGLLDASGAGLVEWLATIGVSADNNPNASWLDVMAAAGEQPMILGGRRWYHWVATRMGSRAAGRPDLDLVALMNPSPGYMGVEHLLDPAAFDRLGPFSAVWFNGW